jgi:hypothetical protein
VTILTPHLARVENVDLSAAELSSFHATTAPSQARRQGLRVESSGQKSTVSHQNDSIASYTLQIKRLQYNYNMAQVMDIPVEDLPYWMRQARRGWDWGFLLALILGILAAWPFIVRPGLPRTNASENYVFLTADYADALREGRLYPRWSPNALSGYGAPIPNFFPPGAPYSAALIKVLFTNDTVRGVRVAFILGFLIAAVSTYAFVRRRTSAAAGLLAAVLFVYSPTFGSTTPYIRGELSEFLALALAPLLLWVSDRLLSGPRLFDYLSTAFVTAALLLNHPPTAAFTIALTSLLMAYHGKKAAWKATIIAVGVGIGLAAFYWIPALLEQDSVRWIAPSIRTGELSFTALLTPLKPVDLNELIPRPQFTLGAPLLLMAALSIGSQVIMRKLAVFQMVFFGAGIVLIVISLVSLPDKVWLLGLVTLCMAVASSMVVDLRVHLPQQWRRIYSAALITLALMLSLPVLLVPQWPSSFGGAEPIDQIIYEQQGAGVAVLPPEYPLPLTLPQIPTANRLLLSGYESDNINKIAPLQAANRTQISLIAHETHRERFQVQSNVSTPVSLLTAYFPGWQAIASGQPLTVRSNDQSGLIEFEIPPMSGELVVALGPTSIRQNAWLLSAVAIFTLPLAWRRMRSSNEPPDDVDLLSIGEVRLLSFIIGALAVIVIIFASPSAPITLYDRPGHGLADATTLRTRTNAGLELLAYHLDSREYHAGDTLLLTLYWQALRTLPGNYQVQVTLAQPERGLTLYRSQTRSPGYHPATRWRTYLYVQDSYEIPLPPTLAPGEYPITIEVFDCNPNCSGINRLTFFSIGGTNMGQTLVLPQPVRSGG